MVCISINRTTHNCSVDPMTLSEVHKLITCCGLLDYRAVSNMNSYTYKDYVILV